MQQTDIGLIGLGVMGQSLVLNMARHGYKVGGFDVDTKKVKDLISHQNTDDQVFGTNSLEEFCKSLVSPRRIMLMVPAGKPVDQVSETVTPYLEQGDIIIDGGNSHFIDTIRRTNQLEEKGLLFVGMGVSGGEEGALKGPSLMPGGSKEAWPHIESILKDISARVKDGTPCCSWIGPNGSGHFVKMIHNGIEYADMQLICEAYFIFKNALDLKPEEYHEIFAQWNKGELNSYLIEITSMIFKKQDHESGKPLLDLILDTAGQKGTGKWTSTTALDLGASAPTIAEAVFARCISAMKDQRVEASATLKGPKRSFQGDRDKLIEDVRRALYASKICAYAQGFDILKTASQEYDWDLKYGEISMLWREGCIIRAQFLHPIKNAFLKNQNLNNLLLDPYFKKAIRKAQPAWRRTIIQATMLGIPIPAFSSALAYYDSYRCERLPTNLLQAQRDFFGAHTYERIDQTRGTFFHTTW